MYKLTMKKGDVQIAIARKFSEQFNNLNVFGEVKPDAITSVIATIQDKDYQGAGEYHVFLDIHGKLNDGNKCIKENEQITASCVVKVKADEDDSPIIEFIDSIIVTKQMI